MQQWLAELRQNRWLIVPRALAALYGGAGLLCALGLFLVGGIAIQAAVAGGEAALPADGGTWLVLATLPVAILVFAAILLSLARGFWRHEPWAPGTALLIHGLWLASQLLVLWNNGFAVSQEILWVILANGAVIACLRHPPVRRLFQ